MGKTRRAIGLLTAAVVLSLGLAACGDDSSDGGSGGGGGESKGEIKVGAFDFPEGRLLANVYVAALNKAGYKATLVQLGQREAVQLALQKGDIDVIPEYVSSALNYYQAGAATSDDAKNLSTLKSAAEAKGVTTYTPSAATDNYAYVVSKDFSDTNSVKTVSELAAYSQKTPVAMGGSNECKDRSYCKGGLEKTYGMKIGSYKVIVLSSQPAVDGLLKNEYQVAVFNSSDAVLSTNPVVTLEDDKGLNPNDNIVPMVNSKKATPELQSALDGVSTKLTQEELVRMNKETQSDRRPFDKVAEDFVG
jgi:osmoprotectant transport system substrate-binding protein